jgi:hypothetical protein
MPQQKFEVCFYWMQPTAWRRPGGTANTLEAKE